jgi:hypothetical protein
MLSGFAGMVTALFDAEPAPEEIGQRRRSGPPARLGRGQPIIGGASPVWAATKDQWSLAAMGTASIASKLLEPDPAIAWDDEQLSDIDQA